MAVELDELIERYLQGELPPEEARRLEERLCLPEMAHALSQALLLRTLLRQDVELPAGLVERVAEGLVEATAGERKPGERTALAGTLLGALGWAVRGPALALAGGAPLRQGLEAATAGVGNVRYTLAPVTALGGAVREETPTDGGEGRKPGLRPSVGKRPWWRRRLGW